MLNQLLIQNRASTSDGSDRDSSSRSSLREVIGVEIALIVDQVKQVVWSLGISFWLIGISDRSFAAFADHHLSGSEGLQLLLTALFFISWLYLKPEASLAHHNVESTAYQTYLYRSPVKKNGLKNRHLVSQEYILSFPYICQIYHLLSLKHLETVHKFSLNNLKILNVSHFQTTEFGGKIKFNTVLDSPWNVLRIWRQPVVEVDLILHTPYTVELSIPAYGEKRITVMFYTLPLNEKEHRLFIDIYSDLEWPKPLLQVLFHFAACLTLFEDLPYLKALAERKWERVLKSDRATPHETLQLFHRFVEICPPSLTKTMPKPTPILSSTPLEDP